MDNRVSKSSASLLFSMDRFLFLSFHINLLKIEGDGRLIRFSLVVFLLFASSQRGVLEIWLSEKAKKDT